VWCTWRLQRLLRAVVGNDSCEHKSDETPQNAY
jgi:hypothetical protein